MITAVDFPHIFFLGIIALHFTAITATLPSAGSVIVRGNPHQQHFDITAYHLYIVLPIFESSAE